ncbi:flagellar motor switch protein FliG [Georgenia subflava]|uniref:Flagellar motor switch protein FliG n=1 Tax=Georgenia subflava TaxID=1622177 RepID=A0A6N7EPJ8_9MICO|nr:flagellar motor switch protein FliG [Georgenia subflava]MPV38435.1 flagellar motor switch protein FliG [Georgenia subflava]
MSTQLAPTGASGTLTSAQKAAVVLLQIGHERAAKVLAELSPSEVEEITAEIVRMEEVPASTADAVVSEFHRQVTTGEPTIGHGGLEYAQRLLEASFGAERAAGVLDRLSTMMAGQPFDFLQHADARQVQSLIAGEHPQTVALVLAHLRPDRASAILAGLTPELRSDVAHRIALMERASPEVVAIVADNLQHKATSVLSSGDLTAVGGVQPLVEILNRSDPGTEKQILEGLGERDAALADEVRGLMFTFEDIILLDDRAVQLVLRQTEISTLALALKGAPTTVSDKTRRNLSERARENLAEEMEMAGPVRVSEVQEARGAIVTVIRTLEESGQIVIRREGEDDYVS